MITIWLVGCAVLVLWLAFINCEVIYHRNKMRKRYGQRNYDWLRKYMEKK